MAEKRGRKPKVESTVEGEAKPVKKTRRSVERKTFFVVSNGKSLKLRKFCELEGYKFSTVYNRARSVYAHDDSDVIQIDATDPLFSSEKRIGTAKAIAIFENGAVVSGTVTELQRLPGWAMLVTKKLYYSAGSQEPFPIYSVEEYQALPIEQSESTESAE